MIWNITIYDLKYDTIFIITHYNYKDYKKYKILYNLQLPLTMWLHKLQALMNNNRYAIIC